MSQELPPLGPGRPVFDRGWQVGSAPRHLCRLVQSAKDPAAPVALAPSPTLPSKGQVSSSASAGNRCPPGAAQLSPVPTAAAADRCSQVHSARPRILATVLAFSVVAAPPLATRPPANAQFPDRDGGPASPEQGESQPDTQSRLCRSLTSLRSVGPASDGHGPNRSSTSPP